MQVFAILARGGLWTNDGEEEDYTNVNDNTKYAHDRLNVDD